MNVITTPSDPSKAKLDAILIVTSRFPSETQSHWKKLPTGLANLCVKADPQKSFSGKEGSLLVFPTLGQIAASFVAVVGLGNSKDEGVHLRCLGRAFRQLQSKRAVSIGIVTLQTKVATESIIHAAEEGSYRFTTFSPKSKEPLPAVSKLVLFTKTASEKSIARGIRISQAVRYARNLANQPPNLFHPDTLAGEAQKLARERRMRCQVWDYARLKKEGFGGIVAVGQGSVNPPRFVRLDYQGGGKSQKPFVIIGKAITFDTGGISIKPSDKMDEMKFDKCGGIAVLGIMNAVSALKLPINVTGLISSAENMPSDTAYRPGDLVKTLSGKYVEVLNTDAEGRIVLADALTYAHRLNPKAMVDLATLTGACIICFGHECAAVLGNQDGLVGQLRTAGSRTGEKVWPMPIWPEYQEKVQSDIGYVKNTAGREGGTITAACFLNAFVDSKIPWAHLDIAGTAWTSKEDPHRAKGATAFGVRLIVDWLQAQAR
jgi:leucyl aminopeptidase